MRPTQDEYPSYLEPAMRLVPEGNIVELVEQYRNGLHELLEGLGEEESRARYAPDKWSVRQVVAHVTDIEREFAYRILRFARAQEGELYDYEQDEAMEVTGADERSLADHLEDFAAARAATIRLLQSLPAEAWARSGIADGSRISVNAASHLLLGHQLHHQNMLRERYKVGV